MKIASHHSTIVHHLSTMTSGARGWHTTVWLLMLLLICMVDMSHAQEASQEDHPVLLLEGSPLLVVLKTNRTSYEGRRARAEKQEAYKTIRRLDRQYEQQQAFNLEFVKYMIDSFDFARPYFIYDYDLKLHLDGQEGLLLGPELTYDADIVIDPSEPTFYARQGVTGQDGGARMQAYIIYDPHDTKYQFGLPAAPVDLVAIFLLFSNISGSSPYRPAKNIVRRWNRKFHQMAQRERSKLTN